MSEEIAVPVQGIEPYRGESWEELTRGADEAFGAELEKGQLLLGVPFVAVRLTYRPGDFVNPKTGSAGHYVSIDLITGSENELAKGVRRGRIPDPCPVDPGEHLVINEGGTGVYRQTVEYLETRGWVELPDLPKNGEYGESRYDAGLDGWVLPGGSPVEFRFTKDGEPTATVDIRLYCPRGLRSSEYENAYTKTGVTRYIA